MLKYHDLNQHYIQTQTNEHNTWLIKYIGLLTATYQRIHDYYKYLHNYKIRSLQQNLCGKGCCKCVSYIHCMCCKSHSFLICHITIHIKALGTLQIAMKRRVTVTTTGNRISHKVKLSKKICPNLLGNTVWRDDALLDSATQTRMVFRTVDPKFEAVVNQWSITGTWSFIMIVNLQRWLRWPVRRKNQPADWFARMFMEQAFFILSSVTRFKI